MLSREDLKTAQTSRLAASFVFQAVIFQDTEIQQTNAGPSQCQGLTPVDLSLSVKEQRRCL